MLKRKAIIAGSFSLALVAYALPGASLFDSGVRLKVYERGLNGNPDRLIGFTPEHLKRGIKIPKNHPWFIRPMGTFGETQWRKLASDMTRESVPGLDLSDRWDVEDHTLQWLGALASVRWLQLHRTCVTDQGMIQVASLMHLEVLSLSPKTSDTGLKALSTLHQLRELDLRGSRVSETALAHLSAFSQLRALMLNQNAGDAAGPMIAQLKSLKELDISASSMGDAGIAALSGLSLEAFYANPYITDEGLFTIGGWPHMKRLDLSHTQISDAGLATLEPLTHLQELALSETPISDAGLVSLSRLIGLKTLELSGTQISAAGLEFLARLPQLETLSLSWSTLNGAEAQELAKFPHLKTLILDGTPVPETFWAELHNLQAAPRAEEMPVGNRPQAALTGRMEAANRALAADSDAPAPILKDLKMRGETYKGLSGLRKIQRIETQTSELNEIYEGGAKHADEVAEAQSKDFLGDIDVRIKSHDAR